MLRRWIGRGLEVAGLGAVTPRSEVGFGFLLRAQRVRSKGSFFFIQVGAQDGLAGDPIHDFVVKEKWTGLMVEPREAIFRRLRKTYEGLPGLEFLNAAVCDSPGPRTMYALDPSDSSLPDWAHGLGTFDRGALLAHEEELGSLRDRIVEEVVECLTWGQLFDQFRPTKVDLLQVDAEGMDDEIVMRFPFNRLRPGIIRFEHKHLGAERRARCEDFLVDQGYVPVVERSDTAAISRAWSP